jgi:hypothetical protein
MRVLTLLCAVGLLLFAQSREATPALEDEPADEVPDKTTSEAPIDTVSDLPDEPIVGLPPVLPVDPEVKDPVFAVLVGLIQTNTYGTLTHARLQAHLDRTGKKSRLPYGAVREVLRLPGEKPGTAHLSIEFDHDLDLPVPYSILGYHPGTFRTSKDLEFSEWILGEVRLRHDAPDGEKPESRTLVLEDVHLYGLVKGEVYVDIDGWLDNLLGSKLDDTNMVGFMLCRFEGELLGVAMGYNNAKEGRSGALSFREDKIIFPSPPEMKTIGRKMRARIEGLIKSSPVEVARRYAAE